VPGDDEAVNQLEEEKRDSAKAGSEGQAHESQSTGLETAEQVMGSAVQLMSAAQRAAERAQKREEAQRSAVGRAIERARKRAAQLLGRRDQEVETTADNKDGGSS
jgi:hypothetical protein